MLQNSGDKAVPSESITDTNNKTDRYLIEKDELMHLFFYAKRISSSSRHDVQGNLR